MSSRLLYLLFLACPPSTFVTAQIHRDLVQNPDFNVHDRRLEAKRPEMPVNQNYETFPIVQSSETSAKPQIDTTELLLSRASQEVYVPRSEEEVHRPDCFGNSLNKLYITRFLQESLDALTGHSTCWNKKGVAGLKALLERNLTAATLPDISVPTCPVNITSSSNTYSIDFNKNKYHINTISESRLILLTIIHVTSMTLAFFLVYPIILIFSSMIVLGELIERPLFRARVEKWQTILHVFFFLPLVVIGMTCGMVGMGSSDHIRTQHGIIGFTTVILATMAISLYLVERRLRPWLSMYGQWSRIRKAINYGDMILCQAVLLLSGFALPKGIDDFQVMSLCGTSTIPTSLSFSIGMIVAYIYNGAMAAMTLQWWLVRRSNQLEVRSRVSFCMPRIFTRNLDRHEG